MSDQPLSVIDRTCSKLVEDIQNERFLPGEKLPGDRELAKLYHIGRSSMVKVLSRLQEGRYIERIPVYGTFVRDDVRQRAETVDLAFASPDLSLSADKIGMFSWSAIAELIRGIFEETSQRPGVRVTLLYCQDTDNKEGLRHQYEDLCRFHGIIFCGHLMTALKERFLEAQKPALVILSKPFSTDEVYPTVCIQSNEQIIRYAKWLARRAANRTIVLFRQDAARIDQVQNEYTHRKIQETLAGSNCRFEDAHLTFLRNLSCEREAYDAMDAYFSTKKNDFNGKILWCLNRHLVPIIHSLIQKHALDVELFALTSSIMMSNLTPPVTYLREPFYEIGRQAVTMLANNYLLGEGISDIGLQSELYHGVNAIPL